MAKEPNKGPEGKDDAFDDNLEDIDLDDLLMDDDTPLKEEEVPPASTAANDEVSKHDIVDDGEIDLLADDLEQPAEPALAEDLLDLEEEPADAGRQTVLDAGGSRMESPTNGNPSGLDDEIAMTPEAKDEDAGFDLLAEEEVSADVLDVMPGDAAAGDSDDPAPGDSDDPAPGSDDPAVVTGDSDSPDDLAPADDTVPLPPAATKGKPGKPRGGKPLKLGKKGKKGKEEAPRVKVEKPKGKPAKERAPVEKPVALPAGARGSITFVCSECYEEFLIPSSYSQEMVSCPECLHVGKRPDDDFLRTVHVHKAGEKRSFLSAIVVGALLFGVVIALMWMNTPYGAAQAGADGTLSMVLLGAAGLLTVFLIWLVVRFEGNRWEVYF